MFYEKQQSAVYRQVVPENFVYYYQEAGKFMAFDA